MNKPGSLQANNDNLSPELMLKIDEVIEKHEKGHKSLIPVLTKCQEILGYLPPEIQDYIAFHLKIPGSDVYGVVTFYSFFSMVPKGRHTIKACMGTACYVRGMQEILNRIQREYNLNIGSTTDDGRFSLEAVRCLGACGLAPVMVVGNDTHGGLTPDAVLKILDRYE